MIAARLRTLLTALVLVLAAGFTLAQNVTFPRFLEIGTAGTGGAYYPIGIAMAELLSSKLPVQVTAQVTGGAVENVQLMDEGALAIALTQSASAFNGLYGNPPYDAPKERTRALFGSLTRGVFQIVVLANSDIQTVADLAGRRVGLGPAGGTGIELSNYVFDAAGFGIRGLRASYTAYDEALTALGDGNIDAVVVQTALPNPAIRQLESTGRAVRIVGVPDDIRQAINAEHPYFGLMDVPAAMYGMAAPAPTLFGANMVIVDADLSEEVVYQITKTLFENVDVIRNSHPAAAGVSVETSVDVPIPLHPGAERYFREVGVLPAGN
jgi:uncharacterized protein